MKSTTYKPVLRELFPLSVETVKNVVEDVSENEGVLIDEKSLVDYQFEPDLNIILGSILPGLVDIVVYQTLAEAYASEHSARMFAMKNAGDNATTILDSLMLSYNHARQDGITKELSEIVAGAEALSVN
ncbi:F0F1 ATP synthase subunit gamma [Patescibacteria group bacterium]|nr:F0F1 ATP synthase subunit gamma [Patescibacteria group bacterium]MBU1727928.1 F0F1 ATP synthase subunit gamma [Patescibacteria group bacterium]